MKAADEFIAKWQARWPEWNVGAVFLSEPRRETAFAWFALLQELTDAAWSGADATPGLAKLAWWNEELQGWTKGARRHPLGEVLQPQSSSWPALAASLLSLQASRELPPATDPAAAGLEGFSKAVAECERHLFDGAAVAMADDGDARAIGFDLFAGRQLLQGDAGRARQLLDATSAAIAGTRPRRLQSAFLRQRLRRLATTGQGRPPSALRGLWLAWRAARAAR
jgi:phytoene/squalene synthetase